MTQERIEALKSALAEIKEAVGKGKKYPLSNAWLIAEQAINADDRVEQAQAEYVGIPTNTKRWDLDSDGDSDGQYGDLR